MLTSYRTSPQQNLWLDELIVDNFAGGGGASTGIEAALGRPVDIAINHDPDAIAMHTINHPHTKHYCESVWDVDPRKVTNGQPVGLAWFSPDCKHFSKAKGNTPVQKEIRGLAWVACKWAGIKKVRILKLENVEEFVTWGPLIAKRDPKTNRVMKANGTIAAKGEVVPLQQQKLTPDPKRKGEHFKKFVSQLKALGYAVEWRNLVASEFGAPTIRKRFYLIARCDGQPIVWPEPTHGNPAQLDFKKSGLKKWRDAANNVIDWSIPCPSIFGRKKPLADNTMRRIARGIQRYVIDNPKPFVVRIGQQGFGGDGMQYGTDQPLTTITTKAEHCLVMPRTVKLVHGNHGVFAAFMAKHFGGNYTGAGSSVTDPLHTVTAVDHNALVTSHLIKMKKNQDAQPITEPLPTLTVRDHVGEVRAFLIKYYGNETEGVSLREPLHTVTAQDRFGLVTVRGEQYQIVDIGMRMLEPHELFAAQGFPRDYIIDRDAEGNPIPKYKQVARCGNSVCPDLAKALVLANYQTNRMRTAA